MDEYFSGLDKLAKRNNMIVVSNSYLIVKYRVQFQLKNVPGWCYSEWFDEEDPAIRRCKKIMKSKDAYNIQLVAQETGYTNAELREANNG